MDSISPRDAIPYTPGRNASDTVINGIHFNLQTLEHWNYTLYSNSTLSNGSSCYLTFSPYTPAYVFANGSFTNATSCFTPTNPIAARGITSLVLGTLFAATVLFTLINLRKHGRCFLPRERRWSPVGRRTQWYWMLFVAACGAISAFTAVDVDRDYLQGTALILQSFFYTLMLPGLLACVWEGVRNWGSWQERQTHDADPFALQRHSPRARTEFYLPLIFYALDWLVFFMLIPRPWSPMQMQRSPTQTESIAQPAATDVRFKTGALVAVLAWGLSCYSLAHSMYHYSLGGSSLRTSAAALAKKASPPPKLVLTILLLATRVAYTAVSSWSWALSPYNVSARIGWLYGLGYGPSLLILIVFNVAGYVDDNEDKLLIAQRARRGESADAELAVLAATAGQRRAGWWSKSTLQALGRRGRDVETRDTRGWIVPAAAAGGDDDDASGYWWWQRRKEEEAAEIKRSRGQEASSTGSSTRHILGSSMLVQESEPVPRWKQKHGSLDGEASLASLRSGTSRDSRPQVVRSMLDV